MDLATAKKIADHVVKVAGPACSRLNIAGSIRREKPSVKDAEIVAIVDNYEDLYHRLRKVGKFIKTGCPDIIEWDPKPDAKYVRMLLNEGIKLDLFIASRENWGSLYCMRTGSGVGPDGSVWSGFVPNLFKRWKKVSDGGKMSGCLPMLPDGTFVNVPEEEDFFRLCKVEWVEPCLRHDAKHIVKVETK